MDWDPILHAVPYDSNPNHIVLSLCGHPLVVCIVFFADAFRASLGRMFLMWHVFVGRLVWGSVRNAD